MPWYSEHEDRRANARLAHLVRDADRAAAVLDSYERADERLRRP
jgi:hypothetical protein